MTTYGPFLLALVIFPLALVRQTSKFRMPVSMLQLVASVSIGIMAFLGSAPFYPGLLFSILGSAAAVRAMVRGAKTANSAHTI
jgi:hypothetical protein